MLSRRHFLRSCAASSAGLFWAAGVRADDKPEANHPDQLLTAEARKAITAGLKYLKDNQRPDGSFGTNTFKGNVGITSLCGLALLSGGQQPGAGEYGAVLDAALDFVVSKEDARRRGFLNNSAASPHGPMYNHGFAMHFLAVALDGVKDKKRAENLREVLGRAVALTLESQNPDKGWRYQPVNTGEGDLTISAGQLCALRAARDAGIGVPKAALNNAASFIKKCQDRAGGGFRYMPAGGIGTWARTGAGLLALYSAGITRGQEVERGLAFLLKNRPDPKARPDMNYYFGHYYAALATWSVGGEARKEWYTASRDELIARQAEGGNWTDIICPHYATAMALNALQAPKGRLEVEF
jgi:hypothetical protein